MKTLTTKQIKQLQKAKMLIEKAFYLIEVVECHSDLQYTLNERLSFTAKNLCYSIDNEMQILS